jgi:hypothetical protein
MWSTDNLMYKLDIEASNKTILTTKNEKMPTTGSDKKTILKSIELFLQHDLIYFSGVKVVKMP